MYILPRPAGSYTWFIFFFGIILLLPFFIRHINHANGEKKLRRYRGERIKKMNKNYESFETPTGFSVLYVHIYKYIYVYTLIVYKRYITVYMYMYTY